MSNCYGNCIHEHSYEKIKNIEQFCVILVYYKDNEIKWQLNLIYLDINQQNT